MADDASRVQQNALTSTDTPTVTKTSPGEHEVVAKHEHYEEVAEYRIGEGPVPLALLVAFALIILWAMISWIPFFGY